MAVHLFSGRILSVSLAASLIVSLVVSVGAAAPARADHYLTHPAPKPVGESVGKSAGPSAATLVAQAATQAVTQAVTQAGMRSAAQKAPQNAPQKAPGASSRAAALFKGGTEIKIKIDVKKDAGVYITARNIPKNDRLLEAYNANRLGEATAVPGLLGIANQAHRAQDPNGRNEQAYSLANAMRDAIWRRNTAARLKSLTASQSACGTAKRTPSIGLIASC